MQNLYHEVLRKENFPEYLLPATNTGRRGMKKKKLKMAVRTKLPQYLTDQLNFEVQYYDE